MSFFAAIASVLPGKKRGEKWARAMKAIGEAAAAEKAAAAAATQAENAFLALSADEQVEIVHAAWVVNATPEPVRAKKAFPKKKKKVVFGSTTFKEVPVCLLQSSDRTWKFKKVKHDGDTPDMEYPLAPPLALLRAVRLAEELSDNYKTDMAVTSM